MDSDRLGPLLEVDPGDPRTHSQSQSKSMPELPGLLGFDSTIKENARLAASVAADLH
jgi:hypothetical protein